MKRYIKKLDVGAPPKANKEARVSAAGCAPPPPHPGNTLEFNLGRAFGDWAVGPRPTAPAHAGSNPWLRVRGASSEIHPKECYLGAVSASRASAIASRGPAIHRAIALPAWLSKSSIPCCSQSSRSRNNAGMACPIAGFTDALSGVLDRTFPIRLPAPLSQSVAAVPETGLGTTGFSTSQHLKVLSLGDGQRFPLGASECKHQDNQPPSYRHLLSLATGHNSKAGIQNEWAKTNEPVLELCRTHICKIDAHVRIDRKVLRTSVDFP